MELTFYKGESENIPSGSILFNTSTQKIYLKDGDNLVCYSTQRIPKKVLPDYIGYGTDYGGGQTVELNSDFFYIIGRCESLTLTLPEGATTDCQEYCCQFFCPSSTFSLTLPTGCVYQEGIAPEFKENTCYQLVIVNNCVTWGKFSGQSTEPANPNQLGTVSDSSSSHILQLNDNHGLSSGTYTLKYVDEDNNPLDSFRDISTFTI